MKNKLVTANGVAVAARTPLKFYESELFVVEQEVHSES
jgi:hypothetical protein